MPKLLTEWLCIVAKCHFLLETEFVGTVVSEDHDCSAVCPHALGRSIRGHLMARRVRISRTSRSSFWFGTLKEKFERMSKLLTSEFIFSP